MALAFIIGVGMRVLYGNEIGNQIQRLIESARPQTALGIVTAYFKPWDMITRAIINASMARGVKTFIIVRGGEVDAKHREALVPFVQAKAQCGRVERLHAKFYINSEEAIVTSMNLVEASALNSWEIGIHLSRVTDAEAYQQVVVAFQRLAALMVEENKRKQAEASRESVIALMNRSETSASDRPTRARHPRTRTRAKRRGTCIRCGAEIPLNPERPLCRECYDIWSQYSNPKFKENYCHLCGREVTTSFERPLCRACFKRTS